MQNRIITARTPVCAVIGDPVEHSLSPQIHNTAFSAADENMVYTAFHVRRGDLERAMAGVRALGIHGLSVTIPHKVDIIPFLDEIDPEALAIGSVNTVLNSSGTLIGCSTDGPGAVRALRASSVDPEGSNILVLGSGGAARAVSFALKALDPAPDITILGVELDELDRLVGDLNRREHSRHSAKVRGAELTDISLSSAMRDADFLVHSTPVGMSPDSDRSLVPPDLFRPEQVVFDVVYTPRRTRLLRDAESTGAKTVSGLGMFVNQAAIQFELWTGKKAPLDAMTRAVEEALYEQIDPGSEQ